MASLIQKIKNYYHTPKLLIIDFLKIMRVMSTYCDKFYIEQKYKRIFGTKPDLKNPKTFNEKLNWLKLYDHDPSHTDLVDKCKVKSYIADEIGKEYVIPTLGVWERAEDIDFDSLPDKFVLKATHDSGSYVICRNKNMLNKEEAIAKLQRALKNDFYKISQEWPYKNVERRIIAEELLDNGTEGDIPDYKFFCFNGKVKFMKVDLDRSNGHIANFYDRDFNYVKLQESAFPTYSDMEVAKPTQWTQMVEIAEHLSEGFPFIRVDLYVVSDRIYFGELTFYPYSGFMKMNPEEADLKIGEFLDLSKIEN